MDRKKIKNYCWLHLLFVILLLRFCTIKGQTRLNPNCRETPEGWEYIGKTAETKNGLECQRWIDDKPHYHYSWADYAFPDGKAEFAENFCRNPYGLEEQPWCYTMNPKVRWEPCDIPLCTEWMFEGGEEPPPEEIEEVEEGGVVVRKRKKSFISRTTDNIANAVYKIPILGKIIQISVRIFKNYKLVFFLFILPLTLLLIWLFPLLVLCFMAYVGGGRHEKRYDINIPTMSDDDKNRIVGGPLAEDEFVGDDLL